ncbi:MAG: fibronectin type III domain-containing protein, partial [Bacteroidales bacterium]|nr:fibronectin type III domain-containing protein [Bacteroidales bacterium]
MADTIATIAVGKETINKRAFEFEVPANLLQEGRAQVAFYLQNPKGSDDESNNDLMLFEIYDVEYAYAADVCPPVSNLKRSNTTSNSATFAWDGYVDHYKFFWGLRNEADYMDSVKTTETSYTLTGLKDNTQYKVKVTGYCDEAETVVSPGAQTTWFITFEGCHTPAEFT